MTYALLALAICFWLASLYFAFRLGYVWGQEDEARWGIAVIRHKPLQSYYDEGEYP